MTDLRSLIEARYGHLPFEPPEGLPPALAALLDRRAGIAEHGLFLGLTHDLIVAGADGLRHLQRDPATGRITALAA